MQRITTRLLQPVEWQTNARCTEVDPEIFFPERGGSSKAAARGLFEVQRAPRSVSNTR